MTARTITTGRGMDLRTGSDTTISLRTAARIAGASYLVIFALAIFANFVVREGLIEPGDAAATVANITESIGLFRWGLIAFLGVFVLDVVVAWALHVVFRAVHRDASLITAWLRIVYTVFLGVALVFFFEVLQLLGGAAYLAGLGERQLDAQVMLALESFDFAWLVGLAAFGVHLALLGVLVVRSGYVTKVLGYLLIAAGAAYVLDTVANGLLSTYADYEALFLGMVAIPSVIGEGWLGLWLLLAAPRRLQA